MSLLSRIRQAFRSGGITAITNPQNPAYWLQDMVGSRPSLTGQRITESTAIGWVPLMSGVRFLSDTMGAMPLDMFRRTQPRGRQPLFDHPLARLYRNGPNPEMTWDVFAGLMQCHAELWGNGYAQIMRNNGQEVIELWPLNPDRVRKERDADGQIQYRITLPADGSTIGGSNQRILQADQVFELRGFSTHGFLGERLVALCKEAVGLGLATEEFAARFFGDGANAGGFLEHPALLSEEAHKRLKKQIDAQVGGLSRAHRTLILEEGVKWQQTTIEPEKAQFLGTRTYQVLEACRMLRIPPHILYELSRATFSNIEQQNIELVQYTLTPRAVRWEKELARQCLSDKMRNTDYAKFNMAWLLRGDNTARAAFYTAMRNAGVYSVNDIRDLEDLNPIPNGDTYLQPANMVPLGTVPQPQPPAGGDTSKQVAA